jgi:hypothetical protein
MDKRLVAVEWLDAACDGGWQDEGHIPTVVQCSTVGWLWHEDEKYIAIVCTVSEDGGINQTMAIPRGMITKIVDMTTA